MLNLNPIISILLEGADSIITGIKIPSLSVASIGVMRFFLLLVQIVSLSLVTMGAKSHLPTNSALKNKEVKFLVLKLKKELSDKKLTPLKKYTLAVLAARELRQLQYFEKATEFYQLARELKVNENKTELTWAFSKKNSSSSSIFFYEVNLKKFIDNKQYEKAILSLNPDKFNEIENTQYRIIYDLLNAKIKKRAIKKLYCFDEYQKNPEDYQYSNLLCDLLITYLRDGKIGNDNIKIVEEYFMKQDLREIYLLELAKDIQKAP